MGKILIIAGGTGGHIFPALAVAELLKKSGWDILWLGSHYGMEKSLVAPHYPLQYVSIRGIRRKGLLAKIVMPGRLLWAIWKSWRVVCQYHPHVVLAMGGYVSGPGSIAARLARKPLIIHEQNAIPGFTNRILAHFAYSRLQAFPHTFSERFHAQTIGNPVSTDIVNLPSPLARLEQKNKPLKVLVLGGSQGATPINNAILALMRLAHSASLIELWHQTGKNDFEKIKQHYGENLINAHLDAFIQPLAQAYAWADLVICRAGAMTVSEIAACGLPAILIPFPQAVDNHQLYNARILEERGAAIIMLQETLTPEHLLECIKELHENRGRLMAMAIEAKKMAKPHAAYQMFSECQKYNCNQSE